ncbi:hypothetical protein [Nocardia salmonicida]|uniref:hypothetical protein n=1 Tax=Nocardia salmonicida TaxID=53431 RepID=UPI0010424A34|nr:hypothetical protein [Nocardia salmonicida]
MLIIDSPQKNFGKNDHDQAVALRMYEWISRDLQANAGRTGRHADFQVIIVDNHIPDDVRSEIPTIISFSSETALLEDIPETVQNYDPAMQPL